MAELANAETIEDCADFLRWLSKEIRSAGDMGILRFSENGVTTDAISVADHIWLVALRLDGRTSSDEDKMKGQP